MKGYFFLGLAIGIGMLGCSTPQAKRQTLAAPEIVRPDKVLQVGFLVMDGVYNTELTAPMDIFHHTIFHDSLGMEVFTIAKDSGLIRTFEGLQFLADYSYRRDDYPKIDVLVVPSAEHHLDTDLEDEEMLAFVRKTAQQASYVLSLCDGAFVLAEAGLLDKSVSTTFPSDIPAYKKRFPQLEVLSDLLFVHDGKYLTSAGGAKSFEPAMYLVEHLYGQKAAQGVGRGMVIDWDLTQVPHQIIKP
ncbi:MAG: DJ-1/PfpI family protein [Bacteroidota bacterium]